MDGTLLNDKSQVSRANKEALKKVAEKGITIALATGRGCKGAKLVLEDIGVECAVIGGNGAQIMVPGKKEPLHLNTMTKQHLRTFHQRIKPFGIDTYYMTDWGIITDFELPPDHIFHELNKSLPEDAKFKLKVVENIEEAFETSHHEILKAMCVENDAEDKLEAIRQVLNDERCFEVAKTWHNTLEIMNKGTSKGEGVKKLADYLGVKKEEIMCIGDSENDLPMFEEAGFRVAMGNAFPHVKEKADAITLDYTQSGVAKALEDYVL